MTKYSSEQLLDRLAADVREILLKTEQLKTIPPERLRERPAENAWSVVEVFAHLNYYARYYIGAMEKQLDGHQTTGQAQFAPGWLGNYFTKLIGPAPEGEAVKTKMTSPKDSRPKSLDQLDIATEIQEFIAHQHQLLSLLQIARSADLGRIRVPISLSRFIRMKLGDTFRFVIAHEQRHFQQIDRMVTIAVLGVDKIGNSK